MCNKRFKVLFFVLLVLGTICQQLLAQSVLLPQPQSIKYGNGKIYLAGEIRFVSPVAKEDEYVIKSVKSVLNEYTAGPVKLVNAPLVKGIILERTGNTDALPGIDEKSGRAGREYYEIKAKDNLITLKSASSAGLFYAIQMLKQLISRDEKGMYVPEVTIEDWPTMPYRGFMMDMTHMQLPTMDEIKKQIDFLAQWKYNQYHFYSETNIELEGYPLLAPNARFSKQQIKEIIKYANERFIDVVPTINLYGHLHDLFKFEHYADLAATPYGREFKTDHPKIEAVINDWINQFTELFNSPFLNIGFDETYLIKYEAERQGIATDELYLGMLNRTIKRVEEKGKKVLFYADRLQLHQEGIAKVEGNPVVIAWHYYLRPPFEKGYDEAIKPFYDHKLPVFVQSATLNWRWLYPDTDLSFENNQLLVGSARKFNSQGYVMSAWTDSWSALTRQARADIAYGAMISWQAAPLNKEDFFKQYCQVLYPDNVAELVKSAHLALAESARITRKIYGPTSDTIWEDPFSERALTIYSSHKEEIKKARLMTEKAQIYLREAMKSDVDSVTLFSMFVGAKLLDYMTAKHLFAGRIADVHKEHQQQRDEQKFRALMSETMSFFSSLSVDMHDMVVEAKGLFRKAWLNEYTDYRLEIAMARFDRELYHWLSVQKKLQRLPSSFKGNEALPPLQEFLSIDWD